LTEQEEEKLFARKSSGLVKEANSVRALFFNWIDTMGTKFGWSVAYLGLISAPLILGFPSLLWFFVIMIAVDVVLGIVYVQVVTPMPRSGADYVVPSRVMGPFWGWINSWMIIWGWMPLWGYMGSIMIRNLQLIVGMLNVAGVTGSAAWIASSPWTWIIGMLTVILGMIFCLIPPKRMYALFVAIGVLGIIGFAGVLVGAAVGASNFAANLQSITGMSVSQIEQTAAADGFSLSGTLTYAAIAGLMGYVVFAALGGTYPGSIAGELRGDIKKTLAISIFGMLAVYFVYQILYVWGLAKMLGYEAVASWSYLYWNTNSAPLGLPPINGLLAQIAIPSLWPLWVVMALAGLAAVWAIVPASMLYINRQMLYWGMDRMLPKSITTMWRGVPWKIFVIEGVGAAIFFYFTIEGLNPVVYFWWSDLLSFTALLFPAVCGIIIALKRKQILEAVPWKRWLLPMSILLICLIVPIYFFGCFAGGFGNTPGQSVWSYAVDSGLVITAGVIVAGVVVYYAVRAYNTKRGVLVNQIFKEIPPE